MRVLNDKEERAGQSTVGWLPLLMQTLLNAIGISSGLFGPLPMILSETRFTDPWPKLAALSGTLVAILLLSVSPAAAIVSFILGVFIADRVKRGVHLWPLVAQVLVLASLAGLLAIIIEVPLSGANSLIGKWSVVVDYFMEALKASFPNESDFPWDNFRELFFYQGAFLYLSFSALSFWVSLGLASHLGWLSTNKVYSGDGLRSVKGSVWIAIAFLLTLIARYYPGIPKYYSGLALITGTLTIMQGCIFLSNMLRSRQITQRARTIIYSFSILFGAYLLLALGVICPFVGFQKRVSEVRT